MSDEKGFGSDKNAAPDKGGDQARKAQEWAGGSKASKGPVTRADKANELKRQELGGRI